MIRTERARLEALIEQAKRRAQAPRGANWRKPYSPEQAGQVFDVLEGIEGLGASDIARIMLQRAIETGQAQEAARLRTELATLAELEALNPEAEQYPE